jgi:hypothetical protein
MKNRGYIVTVVTILLLIFGPVDDLWPFWLVIRIGYLIIIPLVTWFLLALIWKIWMPTDEAERRLSRTLAGITSGIFISMAIFAGYSESHLGNTQVVRSLDGYEDVGDYILLPGPDWGSVFLYTIIAVIAFWVSIRDPNNE